MTSPSLAVITAGRPKELEACISSYLAINGCPPSGLSIFDDSRHENDVETGRQAAATASRQLGIPVRHTSRSSRQEYVSRLVSEGIPRHIAGFCLCGLEGDWCTTGANRNAALLDLAGEKLLMCDDDTRGEIAISPSCDNQITAEIGGDPTDIQVFPSRENALAAATWGQVDLFANTERLLGWQPGENAADSVRLISYGVVGDSGFYSPVHLLWNTSRTTADRLRNSEALLRIALESREVIRMVLAPTLTRGTVCMATVIGLDNRSLLPPFLPVGRNQDGFFGNLLFRCFPSAWTLHMPYALLHAAPAGRSYNRLTSEQQTLRLSELIIILLARFAPVDSEDASPTLAALGRHLCSIASTQDRLERYAREAVRSHRLGLLHRIEEIVEAAGESSQFWREEILSLCARLRELVESLDCWIPMEFLRAPRASARQEIVRIIQLTGELLQNWSNLTESTLNLRAYGHRISEPI